MSPFDVPKTAAHSITIIRDLFPYHSIVLLRLIDADYKFIWAEVRFNGAASDAQIVA